jgi:hypothetical protein
MPFLIACGTDAHRSHLLASRSIAMRRAHDRDVENRLDSVLVLWPSAAKLEFFRYVHEHSDGRRSRIDIRHGSHAVC